MSSSASSSGGSRFSSWASSHRPEFVRPPPSASSSARRNPVGEENWLSGDIETVLTLAATAGWSSAPGTELAKVAASETVTMIGRPRPARPTGQPPPLFNVVSVFLPAAAPPTRPSRPAGHPHLQGRPASHPSRRMIAAFVRRGLHLPAVRRDRQPSLDPKPGLVRFGRRAGMMQQRLPGPQFETAGSRSSQPSVAATRLSGVMRPLGDSSWAWPAGPRDFLFGILNVHATVPLAAPTRSAVAARPPPPSIACIALTAATLPPRRPPAAASSPYWSRPNLEATPSVEATSRFPSGVKACPVPYPVGPQLSHCSSFPSPGRSDTDGSCRRGRSCRASSAARWRPAGRRRTG